MEERKPDLVLRQNAGDLWVEDVSSLYDLEPSTVHLDDHVWKMVAALITRPRGRNVYVLDDDRKLVGTISFRDLLRVTNARLGARRKGMIGFIQYLRDVLVEDVEKIMRKPVRVRPRTNLLEALRMMEENKMNDMPIVDEDNKLIGELSGMEILRFAYADLKRGDEDTAKMKEAERAK